MKTTFPIFRSGNYGKKGIYTADDVQEIFENYDPDFLSAPFTVDHKQDGPAFGYAKALHFEDGVLFASSEDLADVMKDAVKGKHFGRVSVEIFKNLPEKGRYLKAISFLGVKTPEVKGFEGEIAKTAFEDAETESIDFEVSFPEGAEIFELTPAAVKTDTDIEKFEAIQAQNAELQKKLDQLEKDKTSLSEKFAATEAERKAAEEKLQKIEFNQRRLEFEQWLNSRLAYGNVAPANKEKVMDILMALDSVELFEHDGREIKGVELFQNFVESLPKIIDENEKARKDESMLKYSGAEELAEKAREYRNQQAEKGKVITFSEAVEYIQTNQE